VHKKLTILSFLYTQYIVGIGGSLAFRRYGQVRDRCWSL